MRRIPSGILVVGLALAVGCGGTEPASLHVSMTATPTEFRLGEHTSIRLVVRNVGTRTAEVSRDVCAQRFSVVNAAGVEIAPSGRICLAVFLGSVTLAPGDSAVLNDYWDGRHGMTGPDAASMPAFVPAGDYTLAPTRVHEHAAGNPISVRVLPPIE